MGSGDDDIERVAHHLTFWMGIEGTSAGVHGRRKHIGFKSEQEFTDSGISPRTDVSQFLLIVVGSPRLEPPVLIIDKYSPVLHRWGL